MDIQNDINQVLTTFAKLNSGQRAALMKVLRSARRQLDFDYPSGLKDFAVESGHLPK